MATITVMKNFVMKKAQGSSDKSLKDFAKLLKNYGKLDVATKKKVSVATEKLYTKLKSEDSKPSTRKAPAKKGVTKKRIATQDLKSILAKFKAKVGAKAYKEAVSGTTIKQDAERPALPKGKRFSKVTGKPYWENRANRSDVKQPPRTFPRLAKGGQAGEKVYDEMMNVGKSKYVVNFHNGEKKHKDGSPFFDIAIFKNKVEKDKFVKDLESKGYSKKRYAEGGKMKYAKGGITEHGLKVGDIVKGRYENGIMIENDGKNYFVNLNEGKRYTEDEFLSGKYSDIKKRAK